MHSVNLNLAPKTRQFWQSSVDPYSSQLKVCAWQKRVDGGGKGDILSLVHFN